MILLSTPEKLSLTLEPIGYLRTTANKRHEAPRQPGSSGADLPARIVLEPGHNFEQALEDLPGFSKIWLIYWFDRNENWKPKVLPPRGPAVKRGVFATRSPYRPNPIGLSLVDLIEVNGLTIYVGNVDLLDKTPILDIKPYIPFADSHPDVRAGWLEGLHDQPLTIKWSEASLPWKDRLSDQLQISIPHDLVESPTTYPLPHPYRRIKRTMNGFEIAVEELRVLFEISEGHIHVTGISKQ